MATQVRRATIVETGASVEVTAPDNVLVSGLLAGGALASVHIASVPAPGSGFRLEVYGAEGTLAAASSGGAQIGPLALSGARGADKALPSLRSAASAGCPRESPKAHPSTSPRCSRGSAKPSKRARTWRRTSAWR